MRGHIRKRGKKWAIVIELGRDTDGKRRQKWHSGFHRRKDAEAALPGILRQMQTGAYVEPSRLTLRDYLDRWLRDYARHNVAAKTYERYAEIVHNHLAPALGGWPLAKLQPLHLQAYYSAALQNGRRDGSGGLAPRTVLHHHRILRQALQQAIRWQLLARNVADAVEPPRPVRREMTALDEADTARLLSAVQACWLWMPVLLAVTTGMRRGEILAVRWSDVDLKARTLAVNQAVEQTRAVLSIKAPKTPKSRRLIHLPPLTVEALVRHRAAQAEQRLRLGAAWQDEDLVVAGPDGRVVIPDHLTKFFGRRVRALGMRLRFHDLRHTHATQLLRQGVHPKIVSERLGHSTVAITLDTYSHVLPGMGEDAARLIDASLRTALEAAQS